MKDFAFILVIKNIKNPNLILSGGIKNKYKGAYKKIFDILNEDFAFIDFGSEDEELIGNDFYLYFNMTPDIEKLERILKIPNVEIISQRYPQGILVAPNGKPSNLNDIQYELVRTTEFKNWFGDWENDPENSSKVIDENGEPLVVYHGTKYTQQFYDFDLGAISDENVKAFFFSKGYEHAKRYTFSTGSVKAFFLKAIKLFDPKSLSISESKKIRSMLNESVVEDFTEYNYLDGLEEWKSKYDSDMSDKDFLFYILTQTDSSWQVVELEVVQDYLKSNNYNGFITYEQVNNQSTPNLNYAVFEPNQIKLADGTNTTFDSGSDDIRYAKGGKTKGDCYLVAGQLALEIKNKNIDYKGTPYLVHAEVKHSAIEGLRYGHAFIEDDENVYDFSNNREIIMPKQLYYYFGDINPRDKKKYRKYTFKQAREKMLSTGNYGCWDIEVDYGKGGRVFNDKELLEKWKKGESIGFTAIAHLKSKGLIPRADGVKRKSEKYMKDGGTISQTPAPKKDQVQGSDINKKSSSKDLSSAKLIKFDEKTLVAIKNKVKEHNEEYPDKKINLSSAKAVVRRGFGAYSKSHRPTISGGKPNSRVAWGLARLNAFTYKIVNGKSKSGKYSQDDDLIEELGYKVANYENGGKMKDIRCINCGWEWNKKDSELWDMYVCHKCGFDNTSFYTSDGINRLLKGGRLNSNTGVTPNYLKMFLDL